MVVVLEMLLDKKKKKDGGNHGMMVQAMGSDGVEESESFD